MIAQAQFTIADLSDTGIEVVVGTQTASTNAWRGNASFSELRDGQTILYWLPYAGNGSAVTLNLTQTEPRPGRSTCISIQQSNVHHRFRLEMLP